jgi:tellurite methyltransferase
MTAEDRDKWNRKYSDGTFACSDCPEEWLQQCVGELATGRALDLACGLGHNAIWLARQGWQVDAIDISKAGLDLARLRAEHEQADVNWMEADLDDWVSPPGAYDLICVFRFLDRERLPKWIPGALRDGGLLCYETFLRSQFQRPDNHFKSDRFALEAGELPTLYPTLRCEAYEEASLAERDVARYLGRRIHAHFGSMR